MFQAVSHHKYIMFGLLMISLCTFLLILYMGYFMNSVDHASSYVRDSCIINSINQTQVSFACWYQKIVTMVDMPCVLIMVNTSTDANVIFYRNYEEKSFINTNGYAQKCSFIPAACQQDANYLNMLISKSYYYLFPPLNFEFVCFSRTKNSDHDADVLLVLPDRTAFQTSLAIILVGYLLGILTCLYGWIGIELEKPIPSRIFFNGNPNQELITHIKRILYQTHIKVEDVIADNLDICLREKDAQRESLGADRPKNEFLGVKFEDHGQVTSRSRSIRSRSIRSGSSTISISNPKNLQKPEITKLKLGASEYQLGRIEYRVPSSIRLSRHDSQKSLQSNNSNENEAKSPMSPRHNQFTYQTHGNDAFLTTFGTTQQARNKGENSSGPKKSQNLDMDDELSIPEAIPEEVSNDSAATITSREFNPEESSDNKVEFFLKSE